MNVSAVAVDLHYSTTQILRTIPRMMRQGFQTRWWATRKVAGYWEVSRRDRHQHRAGGERDACSLLESQAHFGGQERVGMRGDNLSNRTTP